MAYDDGYGRPQMQFAFPSFGGWVKRLVILNAGIFLGIWLLGFAWGGAEGWLYRWLALDAGLWRSFPALWQLVTHGFMHSPVDPMHLGFNMLMLWMFGSSVQEAIGERRFIAHYLIAVVLGGLGYLLYAFAIGSSAHALGASGAALAMTVAAATIRPHSTVIFIIFPLKLWVLAAVIVGLDAFYFLSEFKGAPSDGVAHSIHLAGAAYGYFAVRRRWLWKDPMAVIERKRAVKRVERELSDDARMDALMAKISREGIGSLTRGERAFLQKQSERKRSG